MDLLRDGPLLIEYIEEHQLFYCHACHSVYVFTQLDVHLKQKHTVSTQGRKQVIQHYQQLPLPSAIRAQAASYRQPTRANLSNPVSFLPILDGFTCSHCHGQDSYHSLNRKAVQEHINQAHQLFRRASIVGVRQVKLQTWYSNTRARYWEVTLPTPLADDAPSSSVTAATATAPPRTMPRQQTVLDLTTFPAEETRSLPSPAATATARAMHPRPTVIDLTTADQLEEVEEAESRRLEQLTSDHSALDHEVEADETTPWLIATEWPKQFASRPLDLISRFAKHPETVAVADASHDYLIGSFHGIELQSIGKDEWRLQQISQIFTSVLDSGIQTLQDTPYQIRCWLKSYNPHEFFPRPFNQLQKPGTRYRYQRQWQCFLCFCFRAWRLEPALRQRLFGPALDLTPYNALIQQIWDLLEAAVQTPLPLPLQSELVNRIQELSWQFLITPIPHHHRHYHYPLLYFTGVLGIHPHHLAYRTPYQFTPILAGLLWVSRVLVLGYSQHPASATHVTLPSGSGSGSASNFNTDHFQSIQSRYLCRESNSGTSHILRFLAYGRQLALNEGPRTNISWAPDSQALTLFSSQNPDSGRQMIQLADFRKMVREAVRHCHRLSHEMMFGWEPQVKLDSLRDNLTNATTGYSFLSDPANQLQHAFQQLLRRAWDGDLQAKGKWQWQRCHRYIRQLEQLQLQLLLCSHFTSGMPARGSELHVLKWQNTTQVMRNIFIHQGQVHLIFEYIKTRAVTNNSFYIVRVLPPSVGKLWFLYLTYIRPFIDCLRHSRDNPHYYSLSPTDQSQQAYAFLNKHDQLYSTQHLSEAIARSSQEHCGQRLTTASYRQVVAAIAKRHIKELVTTATATVDPAFTSIAHQFGHQPQVLDTGYGLDRNYPAKLQPELIAQYQRVSACWHQWLQLADLGDLSRNAEGAAVAVVVAATVMPPQPVSLLDSPDPIHRAIKRKARSLLDNSRGDGNYYPAKRVPSQARCNRRPEAAATFDHNIWDSGSGSDSEDSDLDLDTQRFFREMDIDYKEELIRTTTRTTLRFQVISADIPCIATYIQTLIPTLPLPPTSRGLIYVRNDLEGQRIAKAIHCPFYTDTGSQQHELRKWWNFSSGSWVVATVSPWSFTYLPGPAYIIHAGRPYGVKAFLKQVGQTANSIIDSIVIIPSSGSGSRQFCAPPQELANAKAVTAQGQVVLTRYLETRDCRRKVLAQYWDHNVKAASCIETDSILCDRC